MSQHAVLSPSGSDTWELCAKSAAMQKGKPNDANEYSDEGTAAHLLGSTCLETGKDPEEFRGATIIVGYAEDFDGAVWADQYEAYARFDVRRTFTVDDEMIAGVTTYVDAVREYAGGNPVFAEMRCSISHITGEEGAAGTADAVVVLPDAEELQCHDLKFGMGVRVSAERNKQLMKYAHAVKEELDVTHGPFKRIRLVIHQPRITTAPSEWDCTVEELDAEIETVKPKAELALSYYELADKVQEQAAVAFRHFAKGEPWPDHPTYAHHAMADFNPSDDACRWCKAKAECPAVLKRVQDEAGIDFQAEPPEAPVVPDDYSALGRLFKWVPFFEQFGKAVRAKAEGLLFEHNNDPEVSAQLGIKLVEGKKGSRQWESEEKADELLKAMRLPVEERCNLKLKSPPQIEKVLKESPRRWKRVLDAGLIVQKDGQPSVAPLDDRRPAWVPPDSADDFEATTTEEVVT